ncbi:MAG TPA: PAS domain-containing protein, partial [Thermoanaerobaculia bacterium]|nr:PAS domain-containing protein [Thermoanaerobaculia bacterium]
MSPDEVKTSPMNPSNDGAALDGRGERFLRDTLLDSLNDPAWIKDGSSRFIYVNKALADLVNRTPEEMLGTTDLDYFPQEIAR